MVLRVHLKFGLHRITPDAGARLIHLAQFFYGNVFFLLAMLISSWS